MWSRMHIYSNITFLFRRFKDSPNQKRNVESLKIDGRPKLSSFLYGEQFREANNSQTNQISDKQKLQSSEDSNGSGEDNHTSSGYYRVMICLFCYASLG